VDGVGRVVLQLVQLDHQVVVRLQLKAVPGRDLGGDLTRGLLLLPPDSDELLEVLELPLAFVGPEVAFVDATITQRQWCERRSPGLSTKKGKNSLNKSRISLDLKLGSET